VAATATRACLPPTKSASLSQHASLSRKEHEGGAGRGGREAMSGRGARRRSWCQQTLRPRQTAPPPPARRRTRHATSESEAAPAPTRQSTRRRGTPPRRHLAAGGKAVTRETGAGVGEQMVGGGGEERTRGRNLSLDRGGVDAARERVVWVHERRGRDAGGCTRGAHASAVGVHTWQETYSGSSGEVARRGRKERRT